MSDWQELLARECDVPEKPAKRNKYNNTWTEVDGIKFQSKKEASRWKTLKLLESSGEITDLKRQQPIVCRVNGVNVCKLVTDFSYYDRQKQDIVWEDVKGMKYGAAYQMFKLKKKLVAACTGIDVVEI